MANPLTLKQLIEDRLKVLNVSAFKAAQSVGLERGYINDLLQGKKATIRKDKLPLVANALKVSPEMIAQALSGSLVVTTNYDNLIDSAFTKATGFGGDVPVYAAAEGGPGEMIVEKEPIEYVPRPEPLQGVKEGYLTYISGESMVPEYRPGQRAIVHPKLPPTPDETHIFYTNDPHNDRATIKHLVRITPEAWVVEQWNPPKQFELDREEWPVCHRVVGKYSRR